MEDDLGFIAGVIYFVEHTHTYGSIFRFLLSEENRNIVYKFKNRNNGDWPVEILKT